MSDEQHTPEEVAQGVADFINYLEEIDSKECIYTWHALQTITVEIYDFRDKSNRNPR